MTFTEYTDYAAKVAKFMAAEGIQNLTSENDSEGSFSWRSCDCCQSHLGGNRQLCTGYNPKTRGIQTYKVCDDCVYFAEYGQLDDMTMIDVRASQNEALAAQAAAKPRHSFDATCQCARCNKERARRDAQAAANPHTRYRAVSRAGSVKARQPRASRAEQHARYIDCGPSNWDDR